MALYGFTGSANPDLLATAGNLLAHRGATQTTGNLGGHFVESSPQVSIAWSGTLRPKPPSLTDLYHQHGMAFAEQLAGEFVMAVQDADALYLIRDPAGARTCCYGRLGQRWHVAAEPKGIWQLSGFSRRLRPAAVAQYFTYSFVPGDGTMLENLWEVPAGHFIRLRHGQPPEQVRYFSYDLQPSPELDGSASPAERFRQLMEQETARRLQDAEEPVVFLSGGLDSSIVTAETGAAKFSACEDVRHPLRPPVLQRTGVCPSGCGSLRNGS